MILSPKQTLKALSAIMADTKYALKVGYTVGRSNIRVLQKLTIIVVIYLYTVCYKIFV